MNVTTVSMNGQVFAVGPGGQLSSMADSLKSNCGVDFDDYMRRALEEPFPYSSMGPASRTIENLWSGRRLRIYDNPTEVREGRVVSWYQWNTGPLCPITNWEISIEMDSFAPGDTVHVQGLKATKQHNDKSGTIIKFLENEGRFKVNLNNEKCTLVIRPQNLETAATSYTVNRMNIEGGGTIKGRGNDRLISLEWIDAAEPAIDLDDGVLKALCPTCRSKEPPFAAYNDDETETEDECPVCLERKYCRTLQCSHSVCHDCWKQWRNTSTTISVAEPQIPPEELLAERKENYENLHAVLAPALGARNGSEKSLNDAVGYLVKSLMVDATREDEDGLSQFWRKAKTMAAQLFLFDNVTNFLADNLSIPCLEIMIRVVEERSDEIISSLHVVDELSKRKKNGNAVIELFCSGYCNHIGEIYEEVKEYRCAVPWYQRGLLYAIKKAENESPTSNDAVRQLAAMHCNLGLAQKYAGLLSSALENYKASTRIARVDSDDGKENKKILRREMKQWTGSSGKLTPGC